MNKLILELVSKVDRIRDLYNIGPVHRDAVEQFAEMIWKEAYEQGYWKGISDSSEGQGGV